MNVVEAFLEEDFLVSPDLVEDIKSVDYENFLSSVSKKIEGKEIPLVLNKDLFLLVNSEEESLEINWLEFEKSKVLIEKGKDSKIYHAFLDVMNYYVSDEKKEILNKLLIEIQKPTKIVLEKERKIEPNVIILKSYKDNLRKKKVGDFVAHYTNRYNKLKGILSSRIDLQDAISINRLLRKREREDASIIGIVVDRTYTRNNNIILTLEDLSGSIKVLVNKNKKEIFDKGVNLVHDEVIGIKGVIGDNILFANEIIFPDVPVSSTLKKANDVVYAVFISDLHVGSSYFLEKDFLKFIKWINGELGGKEQREIAKKVKYLFIVGDLVDGIGVYPEQDMELLIKDSIAEQYEKCGEYLKKIRKDIKIIICAGNHDALRIAEPQPVLHKEFAKSLYEMDNVILVTNPSIINVHSSKNFEGFNILMYHGYSFDYYVNNVDALRNNGGYDRPDLVMKFVLQKRHLAPSHTSTLFIPDDKEDPLIIDKIPDFFIAGHLHRSNVSQYNGVTTICCSCFQTANIFQRRAGHHPEPGRVPVVNLKTREVKIMRFYE